jgi:hypothetical protein
MLRSKLGLLGLCAIVLGLMAMSASSAQAKLFKWSILTTPGGTVSELKAELVGKNDGDITLVTHLLKRLFWITCTGFELKGVNLEVLGLLTTGGSVVFTGCEAYGKGPLIEPLGCKVKSSGQAAGTVVSNKGKGELVLHEGSLGAKITPETGETFGTFLTEGCIMPESNPVKGELFIKDCKPANAEKHELEHLIESIKSLTKLNVGAHSVEHLETWVEGSAFVLLGGTHKGMLWAGLHVKP